MNKRKPKIIEDKKKRGEWAESVFMARAHERGLPVSRPWGEMSPYDFVIGSTGSFVSVQVKSTLDKLDTGYVCTVRGGHQPYSLGSFDFLAAYVVPADVWYIIPAGVVHGKGCVTLYPNSTKAKYERYREAWHLMREAIARKEETGEAKEDASAAELVKGEPVEEEPLEKEPAEPERLPRDAMERIEASLRFVKRHLEQ